MNVLVIGDFPESTKVQIKNCFPSDWELNIAEIDYAEPYLANAEALIPEHVLVDASLLEKALKLRFVQTGSGHDNVDESACAKRGITVCSAAGINSNAVAEHTLGLILSWYKNIPQLDFSMKSGTNWGELNYAGSELCGKTIGIIGLGAIGQRVALLCKAFGMNVLGYNHSLKTVDGVKNVSFDKLLKESDTITLHIPLTPETFHMIDRPSFQTMKNSALIVNTSRGSVISENALLEALTTNTIAGACLDVYETEPLPTDSILRKMPNVILTPHSAGLPDGVHFHQARYDFFVRNIRKYFDGETPDNIVNTII
jgi:Phosphoglycerate dehydrogenase and related dehydrogenases